MLRFAVSAAALAFWSLGLATSASAVGVEGEAPAPRSALEAGAPTLAPFAHVRFCKKHPEECRTDGREARVSLSGDTLATIRAVNNRVNRAIRPVNDRSGPLGDVWSLSPARGDCDDFAATKRQALLREGLPVAALRLLVAVTPAGEGHAVLVVATDRGDLVLDNLTDRVRPFAETRLRGVKVQSSQDPRRWLAVGGPALTAKR